ncbi:MAG: hypothetical protein G01um10143_34 [Parcubacteria group bacterium Gr01-1014_3]|nr:MAG: hypothetical protein G01um10143_34 [Parcubacteria group bacterium Gr01-1014_3]
MDLSKVVDFIYWHALSMIEPWDDAVLKAMTVPELTEKGFQVSSSLDPECRVGMIESRGMIFVAVSGPMCGYSSMAIDQKKAKAFYEEVVDALLVA